MDSNKLFDNIIGARVIVKTSIESEVTETGNEGEYKVGYLEFTGFMLGRDNTNYYLGIVENHDAYITSVVPINKVELIELAKNAESNSDLN